MFNYRYNIEPEKDDRIKCSEIEILEAMKDCEFTNVDKLQRAVDFLQHSIKNNFTGVKAKVVLDYALDDIRDVYNKVIKEMEV